MKRKMKKRQKMEILKKIVSIIKDKEEILFAYVFGSFVKDEEFSDIDIGVYLRNSADMEKEFALENEMEETLKIPVDVRIINNAPISFIYNVLRDKMLIKNDEKRADFEGQILKRYFDYVHLLDEYLKEATYA